MDELPKLPYWVSHIGLAFTVIIFLSIIVFLGFYKNKKKNQNPVLISLLSIDNDKAFLIDTLKTKLSILNNSEKKIGRKFLHETTNLYGKISAKNKGINYSTQISSFFITSKTLGTLNFKIVNVMYVNDSLIFSGSVTLNKPVLKLKIIENGFMDDVSQ